MTSTLARLSRRVKNASPVPQSPHSSLVGPILGASGQTSYLSAMGSVGTLFSIVNRISNAVSRPDWHLYREPRTENGERTIVRNHAAVDLFQKWTPFHTRQESLEALQQHIELTGEGWIVISRHPDERFHSLPLEMWVIRPDRMAPVPHPELFISGYVYTGPNGERIPLDVDEVIFFRMPNPLDPYRGMGPVQSILLELESSAAVAEYNRNFFVNSAEPGGIIEVPNALSDPQFRKLRDRWNEQHKGVARAHRVAILEHGKWVERKYTRRDMEFVELRNLSRELIREAYGIPKFAVGDVEDINRATAQAAAAWFDEQITVPRLERLKGGFNEDLLPLFGEGMRGLTLDYESPVREDEAEENAERDSKVNAAVALINTGKFAPAAVLDAFDLPPIEEVELEPVPAPLAPESDPVVPALPAARRALALPAIRSAVPELPDIEHVQRAYDLALEALLGEWQRIESGWRTELVDQVRAAVQRQDSAALAVLSVRNPEAADLLELAMTVVANEAAQGVVREAADQDVNVTAPIITLGAMGAIAASIVSMMGKTISISAGREALRIMGTGTPTDTVVTHVQTHLEELTDAQPRLYLGNALTNAQHHGRLMTYLAAPTAAYYASEQLDKNTCQPCKDVHGKWLGNDLLRDVPLTYPTGGYIGCLGRARCRGMVVAIWRPEQVGDR